MKENRLTCPVCNTEKAESHGVSCHKCGFSGAYYTLFSGERAYEEWRRLILAHKKEYAADLCRKSREEESELCVTGDRICFLNGQRREAVVVKFNDDKAEVLKNVKQVSLCGLYRAWVCEDGTIGSSGDDESGQRRLSDIRNAAFVATSPKCTYVVMEDGTVAVRGASQVRESVGKWTDIRRIVCDSKVVIGLKKDGTVIYEGAEGAEFLQYAPVMKNWSNVKEIAFSGQYVIALSDSGAVYYAGAADERSAAAEWKDIVAVCADGQYAIGLTGGGEVRLAGRKSSIVDFGRSEASLWKNIVFIAADRAVIAGLTADGELKVVGNVMSSERSETAFKEGVYESISVNE